MIAGEWVPHLFLFDFIEKTRVPLKITEVFSDAEKSNDYYGRNAFGMVPGTGDFYMRWVVKPNRERLRTFTVMTDGTLVPKDTLWARELPDLALQPHRAERAFFFLPIGQPVTAQGLKESANFIFRVGKEEQEFAFEARPG